MTTITRHCAYGGPGCKAPRAFRVTEKAVGARKARLAFCCAEHYPGAAIAPPPTMRVESAYYVIEPLDLSGSPDPTTAQAYVTAYARRAAVCLNATLDGAGAQRLLMAAADQCEAEGYKAIRDGASAICSMLRGDETDAVRFACFAFHSAGIVLSSGGQR